MAGGCSCNFYITCCLYAATTANIDLGFYGIIAKDRTVAAANIKKTQKRANALKNITIPMYTNLVYNINNALEEKEREEFTRLKVIKRRQ